jgi:hypothetical protein
MSEVFNSVVGEIALREIFGWLFGNARAAFGTLTLLALLMSLVLRHRLPRAFVPQQGIAIMIFCCASLSLMAGIGERHDERASGWAGRSAPHATLAGPALFVR